MVDIQEEVALAISSFDMEPCISLFDIGYFA